MEVKMPFLPEFEQVMDSGQKTMTSRTKWFGREGDYFKAFGHIFIITNLVTRTLGTVRNFYYQQEGCNSPEEFEAVWRKIHPRSGFRPEQRVKCHEFKNQRELAYFHIHEFDVTGRCHICGYQLGPLELNILTNVHSLPSCSDAAVRTPITSYYRKGECKEAQSEQ
jgi:hypothetical protein